MLPELTSEEVRVLGCLIEKEATTPDVYPLTVNALVNACNQTSNRFPVVDFDDRTVLDALHQLREQNLARVVHSVHNRALKYRHVIDETFAIERRQVALLGVLLLRGPQTAAELRARTDRYGVWDEPGDADTALERLAGTDPDPDGNPRRDSLVVKLARQPGQKEQRYAHLLAGTPDPSELAVAASVPGAPGAPGGRSGSADRIAALEQEVQDLRDELAEVRAGLDELRRLFD